MSQRRILINDLLETYKYLDENMALLGQNASLAAEIVLQLRNEPLLLNVDDQDDPLIWLKGGSLAFDCDEGEGSIFKVRKLLFPFNKLLEAAGVLRVHHPKYTPRHDALESDSTKLQALRSGFDDIRRTNTLTDVEFITAVTNDDLNNEPLLAHRCFLAACSDYFKVLFAGDFKDSCKQVEVSRYSRKCIQLVLGTNFLPLHTC